MEMLERRDLNLSRGGEDQGLRSSVLTHIPLDPDPLDPDALDPGPIASPIDAHSIRAGDA